MLRGRPHSAGYGCQTALWVPRLTSLGHDVAIAAFHGLHGAPLRWTDGIMVYPGSIEHMWAQDLVPGHYRHHQADLLITLMDAWVLAPEMLSGMRVAHWMPVDCAPLSAMDRKVLSEGKGRPIAMSQHGRRMLEDAGYSPCYIPHGVDSAVFVPPADRGAVRDGLRFTGQFVVGINAANQDPFRKGFAEQLEAFARFARAHPEALLLIHSRAQTRQGIDLSALIAELGIPDGQVRLGDQYLIAAGLAGQGDLAQWYGALDVLSNCSYGEGFGLPVLEAQACGTPAVVTDCTAMTELCGSGWLVKGSRFWNRAHSAFWTRPSVPAITGAYEEAFALWQSGGLDACRDKARSFALGYDADKVLAEFWEPCLKELCAAP
jgi:glycosyltransferase involved in cell wall biosynthesis